MTSVERLMAAGVPPLAAVQLGQDNLNGLVATGTTKATALLLAAENSVFATVATGTGALLPPAEGEPLVAIYNGGAQTLSVYAASGETINALSSKAAFSVTAGKTAFFMPAKKNNVTPPVGQWLANLSA